MTVELNRKIITPNLRFIFFVSESFENNIDIRKCNIIVNTAYYSYEIFTHVKCKISISRRRGIIYYVFC